MVLRIRDNFWLSLLEDLPLGPTVFIADSAATYLGLQSCLSEFSVADHGSTARFPSWVPCVVDVFCAVEDEQFSAVFTRFCEKNNVSLDSSTPSESMAVYHLNGDSILVHFHMRSPSEDMASIVSELEIDICRIIIDSRSTWKCDYVVLENLLSGTYSSTWVVPSNCDFATSRLQTYLQRGFQLIGFQLRCVQAGTDFQYCSELFDIVQTAIRQSPSYDTQFDRFAHTVGEKGAAARQLVGVGVKTGIVRIPSSLALWGRLLCDLPLCGDTVFIAGTAAVWLALHSLGANPDWEPQDVDVFCTCELAEFQAVVCQFNQIVHSSSDDVPLILQPVIGEEYCIQYEFIRVIFRNFQPRLIPSDIVARFDLNICRTLIRRVNFILTWSCPSVVYEHLISGTMSYHASVHTWPFLEQAPSRITMFRERSFQLVMFCVEIPSLDAQDAYHEVEAFFQKTKSTYEAICVDLLPSEY